MWMRSIIQLYISSLEHLCNHTTELMTRWRADFFPIWPERSTNNRLRPVPGGGARRVISWYQLLSCSQYKAWAPPRWKCGCSLLLLWRLHLRALRKSRDVFNQHGNKKSGDPLRRTGRPLQVNGRFTDLYHRCLVVIKLWSTIIKADFTVSRGKWKTSAVYDSRTCL